MDGKLAGAQPVTVTLVNTIQGPDSSFVIRPALQLGSMEKVSSVPVDNLINGAENKLTLYKLPVKASTTLVKVTSYGGSVLESSDNAILKVEKAAVPRAAESVTQDENIACYQLTALQPGKVTLTHSNRSDATKTESYEVTVLASGITGDESKTLTAANGQTATFALSSYGGFTAEISDYGTADSGKLWLLKTGTDFASGSQSLTVTANSTLACVRPVTITLKNKIMDGGDKVITVVPAYAVPSASAVSGTLSPTQNTFSGNAMRLYRVSGSKMNIKVSAVGGSKIEEITGVTVSGASGSYATDNTYTVTLNNTSTTSGSFKIVNQSDASKTATVTVTGADASITASNTDVTAKANNGTDNITISSPEGCTASLVNGWNGGGSWFSFTKADVEAGDSKVFTIRQPAANTGVVMKSVTVRLTNAIAGGPNKDITITPTGFTKPTLNATSGSNTDYYINTTNNTLMTTLTATVGGMSAPSSSNSAVATATVNGNTLTITLKELGTCDITVSNKSATTQTATYRVSVSGKSYDGKAVYKDPSTGFYIAPNDAGSGSQSSGKTACSSKSGGSWALPTRDEWQNLSGSAAFLTKPSPSGPGLSVGSEYWSSPDSGFSYCFYVVVTSSSINQSETFRGDNTKQWRCVSR